MSGTYKDDEDGLFWVGSLSPPGGLHLFSVYVVAAFSLLRKEKAASATFCQAKLKQNPTPTAPAGCAASVEWNEEQTPPNVTQYQQRRLEFFGPFLNLNGQASSASCSQPRTRGRHAPFFLLMSPGLTYLAQEGSNQSTQNVQINHCGSAFRSCRPARD